MKKIIKVSLCGLLLSLSTGVSAQVFQEGDFGVDVYYGTPTLLQRVFQAGVQSAADSLGNENLVSTNFGPIGIRGEYMVSNKIGVGLDLGYNLFSATNTRVDSVYNSGSGTYTNVVYTDKASTYKIGIMGTVNFHLVENEKFDLAGVVGIGYGNRQIVLKTTDPNYDIEKFSVGTILFPFSFKAGFEARYFFTPNIGLNMGLGIGQGGLLHGGISVRI